MTNLARMPISSFDPRLRVLIERGCQEYTEVACDNSRKAHHFRNLLTTFRARLRQEHKAEPHLWEPLYGTIISTKKEFPNIVTLRPRLHEFDDVLNKFSLAPLAEDPLEEILRNLKTNGNSQ